MLAVSSGCQLALGFEDFDEGGSGGSGGMSGPSGAGGGGGGSAGGAAGSAGGATGAGGTTGGGGTAGATSGSGGGAVMPDDPLAGRLSAGQAHTCARISNTAFCWGSNAKHQLGSGPAMGFKSDPSVVVPATEPFLDAVEQVIVRGNDSCASQAGHLQCWGDNALGQLGRGASSASEFEPDEVYEASSGNALADVQEFALGLGHTCARVADGRAYCWGSNAQGQLGRLSFVDPSIGFSTFASPVERDESAEPLADVRHIALGFSHSCALVGDERKVLCWGGQVGGSSGPVPRPIKTAQGGDLSGVARLALGDQFSCALMASGGVLCWGANDVHQLGGGPNDTAPLRDTPAPVKDVNGVDLADVVGVSAGADHVCAVDARGRVFCWGENDKGQLGTPRQVGADGELAAFVEVAPGVPLEGARLVAAGSSHTCALIFDGAMICWGLNTDGQLGNAVNTEQDVANPQPAEILGLRADVEDP